MRLSPWLLAAVVISALSAACGSADGADSEVTTQVIAEQRQSVTKDAARASDFTIPVARSAGSSLEISTFSLASHRGKAAVLYFSFVG